MTSAMTRRMSWMALIATTLAFAAIAVHSEPARAESSDYLTIYTNDGKRAGTASFESEWSYHWPMGCGALNELVSVHDTLANGSFGVWVGVEIKRDGVWRWITGREATGYGQLATACLDLTTGSDIRIKACNRNDVNGDLWGCKYGYGEA